MKFYFFAATLGFVHNPLTIKDYVHFTVYTVYTLSLSTKLSSTMYILQCTLYSVNFKSQYKVSFVIIRW